MNAIKYDKFTKHSKKESSPGKQVAVITDAITLDENHVMPLFLKACPSFEASWTAFLQQGEPRVIYISLGVFAQHLLHLYQQNDVCEYPAVYDTIEKIYIHGTDYVKKITTDGLLEAIQNVWRYNNVDPGKFAQYLKPESIKWWKSLNEYWDE